MRVYELAKQLGHQSSKDLIDLLHLWNIDVKSPSSSIDDKVVRRVLETMESRHKTQPDSKEPKSAGAREPEVRPAPGAPPRHPAPQTARAAAVPPAPQAAQESHRDARSIALERIAKAKAARRHQMEDHPEGVEVAAPPQAVPATVKPQELNVVAKPAAETHKAEVPASASTVPSSVPPVPSVSKAPETPGARQEVHAPRVERPASAPPARPFTPGVQSQRPGQPYQPREGQRSGQPYPAREGQRSGQPYPARDGQRSGQPYPSRDGQRPPYGQGQRPGGPHGGPSHRPGGPAREGRPGEGRPGEAPRRPMSPGGPRLDTRRPIELAELPSLKKAGAGRKKLDLKAAPAIEVMKLRPNRRAGGKKVETEEEKTARRLKAAKPAKGVAIAEKRIRPGLFLNLDTLEENVGKVEEKRVRPRTDVLARQQPGKRPMTPRAPVPVEPKVVKLHGDFTVGEFAEKTGLTISEVITKAMEMGEMLTINKLMSSDLCELMAAEFGIRVEIIPEGDEYDVQEYIEKDAGESVLQPRPPVVTIMGHVDHGKTTLLDTIRKTNVAGGEFGGITQHIGAYHVNTSRGEIIFLDTPGHEAFTAMRARGASVTDIVVLVVAADDSLMPQTIEAINHARAASVPIIVAINKIDLPGADVAKVRNNLMQYSLFGEELGGDTIICEVSAKKAIGIDNLLEMILLQAEVMELKANPALRAQGVIIDSKIDPLRGISATVLVKSGTLRQGDAFVCGDVSGRVRHLRDDMGKEVEDAAPAHPVEIIGLDGCPQVGEKFLVMESERQARQIAAVREARRRRQSQNAALKPHVTLEGLSDYLNQDNKPKVLNLILKADVQGSAEAVSQAINRLSTEKVSLRILHSGVGAITESDVQLAMASDAIVIGFNVRADQSANELARMEGIDIKTYRVIYELLEEMQKAMLGMLDKKFKEVPRGSAEVRQVFKVSRLGNIAGCYVTSGTISRNEKMRLVRDGAVVHTGEILSLRRVKDDVASVQSGYECGITLKDFQDIKERDIIETYAFEEVEQTL